LPVDIGLLQLASLFCGEAHPGDQPSTLAHILGGIQGDTPCGTGAVGIPHRVESKTLAKGGLRCALIVGIVPAQGTVIVRSLSPVARFLGRLRGLPESLCGSRMIRMVNIELVIKGRRITAARADRPSLGKPGIGEQLLVASRLDGLIIMNQCILVLTLLGQR